MAINWTEVNPALTIPGNLATPRSRPLGQRSSPPGMNPDTGSALASAVRFISTGLNELAVNHRINADLEKESRVAERLIPATSTRGVVACVWLDIRRFGELEGASVLGCAVVSNTAYITPQESIGQYMASDRLEPIGTGRLQRRFFWGTRQL